MKDECGAVEIMRRAHLSGYQHAPYFLPPALVPAEKSFRVDLFCTPQGSICLIFIEHGRQARIVCQRLRRVVGACRVAKGEQEHSQQDVSMSHGCLLIGRERAGNLRCIEF